MSSAQADERLRPEPAPRAGDPALRRAQALGGAFPFEWDLRRNVIVADPGLGRLYGLADKDPLTYDALTARVHADDRARVLAMHQRAMRECGPYEQEYRVIAADAAVRWVLSRGEVMAGADGRPALLAGVVMDITRRKHAELALAERESELAASRRRFEVLADAMPQMIWSTRPDGYHDYYNGRWYEFTGAPEGSTDGEGWNGMFHPEDQERAWARWRHSLATGEPYEIEYRLRHRSGGYRWVLGRALPVRNAQGEIERWLGTCTDIHDLKETKEALSRSQAELAETAERYRLAAQATNDAIWDWDPTTDELEWNEAVRTLFGYAPDEVGRSGRWWKEAIHPDDRARVEAAIAAVLAGGGARWTGEYRFRRADGSYAFVLDRGHVLRDAAGRPLRMIGAMLDISDRKRLEERQALVSRELHHRVKNSLTTVQAVISSTARHAKTVAEFRQAVTDRITALAKTHTLLLQNEREGADLRAILMSELQPYSDPGGHRVRLEGPQVHLSADAAVALGMAIHELTTNSAKYGAHSLSTGSVRVAWSVHDVDGRRRLVLDWEERGGPPVRPPERQGFGTVLMQRALGRQLGGEVRTSYAPEGVRVRITALLPATA